MGSSSVERGPRPFTITIVFKASPSEQLSNAYHRAEIGRYFDPSSRCHFVVARPLARPRLWKEYLRGARASYRRYGVESVLEYDNVIDGRSTAVFFAALDGGGRDVGGMRAQGPYLNAREAHALTEWAGRKGSDELRREIAERIPAGVIEMKTGWVLHDVPLREELTSALARIFVHSLLLLGVRYAMGTVAAHAAKRWQTTGGVVSPQVTAVAYPDDRYLTKLMWWDSETYAGLAIAEQLPNLISETAQLRPVDQVVTLQRSTLAA